MRSRKREASTYRLRSKRIYRQGKAIVMETQQDTRVRMVALVNLEAMCKRVSGMCLRYWVSKVTANRVYVTYSNPDDYGTEFPMVAVFPCYKSGWPEDKDNPRVVLEFLGVQHDNWHGEGWQAFQVLLDCPALFLGAEGGTWKTREEQDRK